VLKGSCSLDGPLVKGKVCGALQGPKKKSIRGLPVGETSVQELLEKSRVHSRGKSVKGSRKGRLKGSGEKSVRPTRLGNSEQGK